MAQSSVLSPTDRSGDGATRAFLNGDEALAEAAVRAGCRFYSGYPIEPSTKILEYMSRRLPEVDGTCVLAGSEIEAITMVQGAAGAGAGSMIASSSTAMSLMQETMAECPRGQWPIVAVDVCRGAIQGDYYQCVKGGGHGDYSWIVLAPHTAQEVVDLTFEAFSIAQRYRYPVLIFTDVVLAHSTQTVVLPPMASIESPTWATDASVGRKRNKLTFVGETGLSTDVASAAIAAVHKMEQIASEQTRYEEYRLDDADTVIVAFGTAASCAKSAIDHLRTAGKRVGLLRPISLSPFPGEAIREAAKGRKSVICFELNDGQMLADVRSWVFGSCPVVSLTFGPKAEYAFGTTPDIPHLTDTIREITDGNLEASL